MLMQGEQGRLAVGHSPGLSSPGCGGRAGSRGRCGMREVEALSPQGGYLPSILLMEVSLVTLGQWLLGLQHVLSTARIQQRHSADGHPAQRDESARLDWVSPEGPAAGRALLCSPTNPGAM